jgi:uncharacterized membrane protein HdeD (DUF308 family)
VTDPLASSGLGAPPRGPASADVLARAWWIPLVSGLLNLIAGLVILIEPHNSLLAIALVLGIYLVIAGILTLIAGFSRPGDRGVVIAFAILAIIAGAFVIARPGSAVHGVRIVFGLYLLISGFAHFGMAAMDSTHRGREIMRGALELIAGIVFLAAPKLGLAAVALFFGIYLLIRGALEVAVALALREATHPDRT